MFSCHCQKFPYLHHSAISVNPHAPLKTGRSQILSVFSPKNSAPSSVGCCSVARPLVVGAKLYWSARLLLLLRSLRMKAQVWPDHLIIDLTCASPVVNGSSYITFVARWGHLTFKESLEKWQNSCCQRKHTGPVGGTPSVLYWEKTLGLLVARFHLWPFYDRNSGLIDH